MGVGAWYLERMKDQVDEFIKNYPTIKEVYIAIIPDLGGVYALEVEVSQGEIGLVIDTQSSSLWWAQDLANDLDSLLTQQGVKVYDNRDEWKTSSTT
jgi:hypothetical protein